MNQLLKLFLLALSLSVLPSPGLLAQQSLDAATVAVQAKKSSSGKIEGIFEFTVRGTGRYGDYIFLNSEEDYRSPTCLTVAIRRSLWKDAKALAGGELEGFLGKSVRVEGAAERIRVYVEPEIGERKRKWYYQTHVRIRNMSALRLVADA
ncbi:MAG: hypothetical protein KDI66_22105 [Xanthomonadales bacterium]|nr:hypothetical protein [Xanthomonadales bacterium]